MILQGSDGECRENHIVATLMQLSDVLGKRVGDRPYIQPAGRLGRERPKEFLDRNARLLDVIPNRFFASQDTIEFRGDPLKDGFGQVGQLFAECISGNECRAQVTGQPAGSVGSSHPRDTQLQVAMLDHGGSSLFLRDLKGVKFTIFTDIKSC